MGNVLGVRGLFWSTVGALLCAPWLFALLEGDRVSSWLGEAWSDSIRSNSSAESRLEVMGRSSQLPPESLFPLDRSPSWIATVRDPSDQKKRLLLWLAQGPDRCFTLKLIDEKSSILDFGCKTQWAWLSESAGPLVRIPLAGGPFSPQYKELHLRLPQEKSVEGELRWVSQNQQAVVSRFAWVPSPSKDSSFLSKHLMSRVTGSL